MSYKEQYKIVEAAMPCRNST